MLAVRDGQAALRVLRAVRVQLMLTDLRLLVLDGRRLCETLAAAPQYQAISQVLMTIWWDDIAAPPCVTAVLPKPFTIPMLLATVQRCVRAPGTTRLPVGSGS